MTVNESLKKIYGKVSASDKTAFLSAFICGLLIHMPAMLMDVPNHDGLSSMHFSQNMITSGRWFLAAVCAASSFYTVPWIIGLIGILELAITAVLIRRIFETENVVTIFIISALLVAFPSLASTFAYVFTLDGYMAGLLLAVLAVYAAKKGHFILGGISLAFSLGTYQAYLPFAMLLSIYLVWEKMASGEKKAIAKCLEYVYMGMIGAVLYLVLLKVLLAIEGKVLDTYQGIDNLENTGLSSRIASLPHLYKDFVSFTFSKGFLTGNVCAAAGGMLAVCAAASALYLIIKNSLYKKAWFYFVLLITAVLVPVSANVVLIITPDVKYHLIMRYQWVLFVIACVVLCDKCVGKLDKEKFQTCLSWVSALAGLVIIISYAVTDNIGYTNLQRMYEKTYAYTVRLLDRIEQTPGYYQGVPVAIMGVIGDDEFPPTEVTEPATSEMIGLTGNWLIYSADNYDAFIRNYLGATLNLVPEDKETEIYYSDEYIEMESFPGETSVRMIDGIICVKTEDALRD